MRQPRLEDGAFTGMRRAGATASDKNTPLEGG